MVWRGVPEKDTQVQGVVTIQTLGASPEGMPGLCSQQASCGLRRAHRHWPFLKCSGAAITQDLVWPATYWPHTEPPTIPRLAGTPAG